MEPTELERKDRRDEGKEAQVPAKVTESRLPSTEFREPVPDLDETIDLRDYIEIILRRKWLVATILVVVFVTTLIVTLAMTPIFKAEARLEVSPQDVKVTKFEDIVVNKLQTREFIETQVKLLQSQSLAQRVIERLQLEKHPAFNPKPKTDGHDEGLQALKQKIREWLSFKKDEDETLERLKSQKSVLELFHKNLSVQPERNTTIIKIAFTSKDPQVARDVANAMVQEFVSWQMDTKLDAATSAKQQLEKQLEAARIQLEKSEEAMNAFAQKSGIVSLDSRLNLVYRQLEEVNSALAAAESERIAAESVYRQAVAAGADSLPAVIDNKVIQELRKNYIEYQGQYEELKAVYKDEYPQVKILRAKMTEIQQKIEAEQRRIVQSLENTYLTALKKEEALRKAAEAKKAQAMELNDKATQYKILAREVETNKQIFQSLLERSKEIDANVGSEISNIQVVDYALLPLQPYKPRVRLNLLLALVIGLMLGVGSALALEYFDNTVKRIDEISDRFHIPVLGVVPEADLREAPRLDLLVREHPRSSFSEAVRTAKVSIQLSASGDCPLKSIVVTSTNAGEGKSTLASNLALAFASDERVLLVDADLRRPRLHKIFSQNGKDRGLSQYLTGMCDAKDILQKTDIPNLFFISSGPVPPSPAELLASNRMRKLLEKLNGYFDRIIIDAPPFAGFADVLVLGNHADGVILLSTLGVTHREALRIFRKSLLNVRANLLGTIVNRLDVGYHYGYYYKYYKYYHYAYRYGDEKQALPEDEERAESSTSV